MEITNDIHVKGLVGTLSLHDKNPGAYGKFLLMNAAERCGYRATTLSLDGAFYDKVGNPMEKEVKPTLQIVRTLALRFNFIQE